jgi:DNA polymerase (family 10)
MNNNELAAIFDRIGSLLEIKGEVVFKTLAYRRAAESLRVLAEDINTVAKEGRLSEIPGVGKAITEKIEELLATGKLGFLERLEEEVPPSLLELLEVSDLGPKRVALIWEKLGVTNLDELAMVVRSGKLRTLPGMGEKTEARIKAGLEALSRRSKRMLLFAARELADGWLDWLRAQPGVTRAEAAGSLRRFKATVGDLDLVAAAQQPDVVMAALVNHPDVERVQGQGENKTSVMLKNGTNMQLWIQPADRFGTLLQFVSGSKEHNVRLRELAQRKNLSLSERAILDAAGQEMLFDKEEAVYAALGLPWIPPELREDRGEIQAALESRLPGLIEVADLKADLHNHSTWSDGVGSIEEMAMAARSRGLRTLAITDHSVGLGIANGLSAERLAAQRIEMKAVQEKLGDSILLLQGAEVEILADGRLGYPDEVLAQLDIVVASLHSSLSQPREVITERLLKVMHNPHVDIIGHPSGRLLPNREGADLNWDMVLPAAREFGVALEIDANPARMDLDEIYARRAGEMGILISIDTDSHAPEQLNYAKWGVSVARRAWLRPEQVINTWPQEKLLAWLKQRGEKAL